MMTERQQSSTADTIEQMALYGGHPYAQEKTAGEALTDDELMAYFSELMGGLSDQLEGSLLEDQTGGILSDLVNLFNRKASELDVQGDSYRQRLLRLMEEQDGSEVKDVELQRIQGEAFSLQDQQRECERWRDCAAEVFETLTGRAWMPQRRGSVVHRRTMTASIIDAQNFIRARKQESVLLHVPKGRPVLFSGDRNLEMNDVETIEAVLDRVYAKFSDLYLITTGQNKGADMVAASWAKRKGVSVVAFGLKTKGKTAPFDRNREIFEQVTPQFTLVFGKGGIQKDLMNKARERRLKVWQIEDLQH